MPRFPQWATPQRQAYLVELFLKSGGLCVHGHRLCPDLSHNYMVVTEGYDIEVTGKATYSEPVPHPLSDTGWVIVKKAVPVARKLHMPGLIDHWKEDDREERAYLRRQEQRRLHASLKVRKRGPFDAIRRQQYLADRPVFEVVGIGVSAFTQARVAKVVLPEFHRTVWVDLSGVEVSKNKLRKLSRRGGKVPPQVYQHIAREVRRYL